MEGFPVTAEHRGLKGFDQLHTSFETFQRLRTTSLRVIAMLAQLWMTARRSSPLRSSFSVALDAHGWESVYLESKNCMFTKRNMSNAARLLLPESASQRPTAP